VNESELKSGLKVRLVARFPRAVVLRHEDQYTAGIPDMSFTLGLTTWIEVKLERSSSGFKRGRRIQRHTAQRLALVGECVYVIYRESPKSTVILDPKFIDEKEWAAFGEVLSGFDHDGVADVLGRRHHDYHRT
jgi:hypothetical protein